MTSRTPQSIVNHNYALAKDDAQLRISRSASSSGGGREKRFPIGNPDCQNIKEACLLFGTRKIVGPTANRRGVPEMLSKAPLVFGVLNGMAYGHCYGSKRLFEEGLTFHGASCSNANMLSSTAGSIQPSMGDSGVAGIVFGATTVLIRSNTVDIQVGDELDFSCPDFSQQLVDFKQADHKSYGNSGAIVPVINPVQSNKTREFLEDLYFMMFSNEPGTGVYRVPIARLDNYDVKGLSSDGIAALSLEKHVLGVFMRCIEECTLHEVIKIMTPEETFEEEKKNYINRTVAKALEVNATALTAAAAGLNPNDDTAAADLALREAMVAMMKKVNDATPDDGNEVTNPVTKRPTGMVYKTGYFEDDVHDGDHLTKGHIFHKTREQYDGESDDDAEKRKKKRQLAILFLASVLDIVGTGTTKKSPALHDDLLHSVFANFHTQQGNQDIYNSDVGDLANTEENITILMQYMRRTSECMTEFTNFFSVFTNEQRRKVVGIALSRVRAGEKNKKMDILLHASKL